MRRPLSAGAGTATSRMDRARSDTLKLAWKTALAVLLAALAAAGVRRWASQPPDVPEWTPEDRVAAAIDLLAEDPAAWHDDTRTAVRIAAGSAEESGLDSAGGWYVLAVQYQREGSPGEAERLYRRAAVLAPDWSWPPAALGSLIGRDMGRLDEAEQALRLAVALDPDWARPHNSLAVVLRLQGRFAEAEGSAVRALELAPDDIAAQNNYANLLVQLGRLDEAEAHYLAARALDPENAKPAYNLACLYSLMGREEEALENLALAAGRSDALRRDALTDPDFDNIRHRPEFGEIVMGPLPATSDPAGEGGVDGVDEADKGEGGEGGDG
ncbi:MAG: tetratricopeptide repeat protein [Candidatus Hydrogenedentes bacterium]|nr:tetratricopeptide repeat protein [Candidatus Hydrogenedentota bacterium]